MAQFFNDNLKFIRKKSGISQQELADKINVDRSSISKWENGEMNITVDTAYNISKYFNIPLADMIATDLRKTTSYDTSKIIDNKNNKGKYNSK